MDTKSGGVTCLAFSHDGRQIVSGSSDGTLNVWNAATGQKVMTVRGHTDQINCVTFSHDEPKYQQAGLMI